MPLIRSILDLSAIIEKKIAIKSIFAAADTERNRKFTSASIRAAVEYSSLRITTYRYNS